MKLKPHDPALLRGLGSGGAALAFGAGVIVPPAAPGSVERVPSARPAAVARTSSAALTSSRSPDAFSLSTPVSPVSINPSAAGTRSVAVLATRSLVIGPHDNLAQAIQSLRPGDVLRLLPGAYPLNTQLKVTAGLPSKRIQVTAADPRHPPLIRGTMQMFDATNWTLSHLRVQATVPKREALTMAGGRSWRVANCEFFGADRTGAFANVSISNHGSTPPTAFEFVENRVHGAARKHFSADHNVYVNAIGGDLAHPGLIARNDIYNAPFGENIKVGFGGDRHAGPIGLRIEHNTLHDALRQILVHSGVRGIEIRRNLLVRSYGTHSNGAGIYLNELLHDSSVKIENNYGALLNGPLVAAYKPTRPSHFSSRGNILGPDPLLRSHSGRLTPENPSALRYGSTAR